MENERYPDREDPVFSPESKEDMPLIEDLSFLPEEALNPRESAAPEPDAPDAALPEDPAQAEAPPEDFAPGLPDSGVDFMARIPEVDGLAPETDPGEPEDPLFDLNLLEEPPEAEPAPQPPADDAQDQEYRDNGQDFDELLEAPAPKPQSPARRRPTRKGRPKRKKGEGLLGIPHILVTVVWLALIAVIGVTAGRMLWVCAADVLAFGREDKPVTVTVYESDTLEDVTNKLYDAGLIRYKSLFDLYASISHAEEKIKPGIYDLNTRYDYHALVSFMTPRSNREVITLTIPEGYSCRQIFELLEENRICTARDAAAYAANGELEDYWFLENVERGDKYCLEGFLFPDTYEFYKNSTPREALQRMLNNFEKKFSEEMLAQLDSLNETVTGGGYTVREVVTVASLIEKESAAPSESPAIAGVIYNRLFRWDGTPAYLNIDATIVYAQDGDNTTIDTRLDSPYNTYLHTGLTPTPIANPGLSSLQAALNPEMHGYYYYVLNPSTGMHQFSATQEEHESYIAQFYS